MYNLKVSLNSSQLLITFFFIFEINYVVKIYFPTIFRI